MAQQKEDWEPKRGLRCFKMSANFTNDSLAARLQCGNHFSMRIYVSYTVTNGVLLFPLCVGVLFLGLQRRSRQRPAASAGSFGDFCTYNMAAMELIGIVGNTVGLYGSYGGLPGVEIVGTRIGVFPWVGQMLWPLLACVEHYLAVVHPITYLRLKKRGEVLIRRLSAAYIWLQCCGGQAYLHLMMSHSNLTLLSSACQMVAMLTVMVFCSLSAVRVLRRPRPGVTSGHRLQVDQSKRRAFKTVLVIMAVLSLRFGGNLVCNLVGSLSAVSGDLYCFAVAGAAWFNLPSSLVLPLLFLHRAGKLPGFKPGPG